MTGSVTKALYLDSDGFDRTLRLGEDMHLGHSLAQAGGVFVVDREARSWHLGRSQVLRRAEQVNRYNDPYLADLVPTMRPKRNRHGRAYQVPYLEVVVPAGPADETIRLVDSLLDGDVPDLRVTRRRPVGDPSTTTASSRSRTRCWRPAWCTGPTSTSRGCASSRRAPSRSDAEFVLTLPDVSLAPLPAARWRRCSTTSSAPTTASACCRTTSGAAARLERTSALARVARLAGPTGRPRRRCSTSPSA